MPPLYQGPKQEKLYRKQRQVLERENEVYQVDKQQSTALAVIPSEAPKANHRVSVSPPNSRSIPLILLGYGLGIVGITSNAWFSFTLGTVLFDKVQFLCLGFLVEASGLFLPARASNLFKGQRYVASAVCLLLYLLCLVFGVVNSVGFASTNLIDTATARAERITPAVADAQRRLDTLSASRSVECLRRGDKCRQLERDEQQALEALRDARDKVSATADPQTASAAKLVSWVGSWFGFNWHPSADDFAMLRLLLLTILPQIGGLVLMVASRTKA